MDDNPQRPMTEQEAMAQHEADMASMTSWHAMPELGELADVAVPVPRPEYITVDYSQFRNGFNAVQDSALEECLPGRSSVKMAKPEEPKEVNLMPRKMSKVKEWSISARALKRVIMFAMNERQRYDYKFNARYDNRFRIFRIWNASTENVVATVKMVGRDKVVIRYRVNSYYASVMESMNGLTTERGKKVIAIPSTNLAIHRGRTVEGVGQASKSKEAQLGYRSARYLESSLQERNRNARKNNR